MDTLLHWIEQHQFRNKKTELVPSSSVVEFGDILFFNVYFSFNFKVLTQSYLVS